MLVYLWFIFFTYIAGTVQIQGSSLSEFYSDKRTFDDFSISLNTYLCYGPAHVSFCSTFIVQRELWGTNIWEGELVMAEKAGQSFLKELRLKLKRLISISPRFMGEEEQMMGCFIRWAWIYIICHGKNGLIWEKDTWARGKE